MKTIYNNRQETMNAADFINNNRSSSYIGSKGSSSYYNVNGIVWEVWQGGCGNYPTTNNINVKEFKL